MTAEGAGRLTKAEMDAMFNQVEPVPDSADPNDVSYTVVEWEDWKALRAELEALREDNQRLRLEQVYLLFSFERGRSQTIRDFLGVFWRKEDAIDLPDRAQQRAHGAPYHWRQNLEGQWFSEPPGYLVYRTRLKDAPILKASRNALTPPEEVEHDG